MTFSTESLARACAIHPKRTIGAWIALVVLAFAAIALLLGGSLTTDGAPTNNPESQRADDLITGAFPAGPSKGQPKSGIAHVQLDWRNSSVENIRATFAEPSSIHAALATLQ